MTATDTTPDPAAKPTAAKPTAAKGPAAGGDDAKGPEPKAGKAGKTKPTKTTSASRRTRPAGRPSKKSERAERVTTLYEQLGTMLQFGSVIAPRMFGAGEAIVDQAGDLGAAWAAWAETSPRVAATIDRMSFGGGGLAVLAAHLPILQAVMAARGQDAGGAGLSVFSDLFSGNLAGLFGADDEGPPVDAAA